MIDSYETPKRPPILPWSQQPVFDPKVPSEKEVRYLGNHNRKCRYYMQGKIIKSIIDSLGIEYKKFQADSKEKEDYLDCKPAVDAAYRCYTQDKYGDAIEKAPKYARKYVENYMNCLCSENKQAKSCEPYFNDIVRSILRKPGNRLDDRF